MNRPLPLRAALLAPAILAGCAMLPGDRGDEGAARELAALLAGEYNNHAQVWEARQGPDEPPARFDVVIQRQPRGATGAAEALVFRQYRGDGALYREARFLLKPVDDGIVQQVLEPAGDDWRELPGCRVIWQARDGGFAGATAGEGCRFGDRRGSGTLVFERRWRVAGEGLVLEETTRRGDEQSRSVYRFQRLREYTGWAGVLPGGPAGDREDGWRLDRELRLHDGGATTRITVDGEPTGYAVRLERVVWPRSGIPMLRLSVLEVASDSLIAYAWAEPGSGRIGLNLGWIQVGLEAAAPGAAGSN